MNANVEQKSKRYIVTVSLYMYADDDKAVLKGSHEFCQQLNQKLDCKATTDLIVEQKFGSTDTRTVFK